MTFSITELGLIVLVVSIGITLANLSHFSNQIKTLSSENVQLKSFVQILLQERAGKIQGSPVPVPPFLNLDFFGDVNMGGDLVAGNKGKQ